MDSILENGRIVWIFEPWCNCVDDSTGCDICETIEYESKCPKIRRVMPDEVWLEPLRLRNEQQLSDCYDLSAVVYAGYLCDWAADDAPKGQRKRLWDLIRQTPMHLDWRVVTEHAENIERCLPKDWGRGYGQVSLGVSIKAKHDIPRIEILRTIPAVRRIVEIDPLLEDLGDIDLSGIYSVSVHPKLRHDATPVENDWLANIYRQCLNQGVMFSAFTAEQIFQAESVKTMKERRRKAKEFEKNVWLQWKERRVA